MLYLNKNLVVEEFINEEDITKYLKSLVVNEIIPPTRSFNVIGRDKNDSSKTYELTFAAVANSRYENGVIVRNYYSQGMVEKFLHIAEEYGEILKIK